jgi:hypothetical protein
MPKTETAARKLSIGLLLSLALLGLVSSLATRYCDVLASVQTTSVLSDGSAVKHQHLDRDGFEWTPTTSDFSQFVSFVCARHVLPVPEPLFVVHVDEPLFNRPPPTC